MGLGSFLGEELAGALQNVLYAQFAPGQEGRITGIQDFGSLAVDGEGLCLVVKSDGAVELAVDGVVLDGVGQLTCGLAGSVDGDDLDVIRLDGGSESQGADTAEAIDANFDHS